MNKSLIIINQLEKNLISGYKIGKAVVYAGYTIMEDCDAGFSIGYACNITAKWLGAEYNATRIKRSNHWPYTGFVKGNAHKWVPISKVELLKILDTYNQSLQYFVHAMLSQAIRYDID